MEARDKIRFKLREVYGDFETYLEGAYEKHLTENIHNGTIDTKRRWATYNQVVLELKHNIKDMLRVKELQYKLTEGLNPSDVCIEVLSDVKTMSPELERLYYKIRNF